MIGCDSKMSYAAFDHGQYGIENAANRRDFHAIYVTRRWKREEVAEQFVGPIDEMNIHAVSLISYPDRITFYKLGREAYRRWRWKFI
jgi:hypothetical protein